MNAAFETPNTEVSGTLAEAMDVGLFAELIFSPEDGADLFIGFQLPPRPGVSMPDSLVQVPVAAMLPDADLADINWRVEQFPGRSPAPEEWVICWRRPAE